MAGGSKQRAGAIGLILRRNPFRRWWHCHRQLANIARRLEFAGVARNDPVYPLILEIGLVPARMGRLLTIYIASTGLALVLLTWILAPHHSVTEITGPRGNRVLIIATPGGARWAPCPDQQSQVCLEVYDSPTSDTFHNPFISRRSQNAAQDKTQQSR